MFRIRVHRHHHHLPPWTSSFDLFRYRRFAIVSWGVHDLFFLEVSSWGSVSGVWCCPFFQDGWSSFVCVWISRLVFQRSLILSLRFHFLFCLVLFILWHFLESASLQLLGESCLASWLPTFRYHSVLLVWLRVVEKIKTHILCSVTFIYYNRALYEVMC
jgi:hypothetical protein